MRPARSVGGAAARRRTAGAALLAGTLLLPGAISGQAAGDTSGPTPGERLPVRSVTLANGMSLLVLPRHDGPPTVAFVVEVGVGSVDEHLGTTGIAHLLEHLLFKGTTTIGTRDYQAERSLFTRMDAVEDSILALRGALRPDSSRTRELSRRLDLLEDSARAYVVPNEFDRILTKAGARGLNATTTEESTFYYVELPANRVQLWFALEADRLRNPVFREFYKERDVVAEERRMRVETSPEGLLHEAELAAAFTMHPYGVPVVGWMSDIQSLRRPDVRDYFRRFYGARNTTVAIVGDVDPDQVVAWARGFLGPVRPGEKPPPVLAVEPPQRGERRVRVVWDAGPRVLMGWHVPDDLDPDAPALSVLSTLLTGGRTSRLYHRLIDEDRLATDVTSWIGPGDRYPRLFSIEAVPRAPHTTREVEEAVYSEIARFAAEGPTEAELQRVRNQMVAGSYRRLESNLGLAFQLADSETLWGDWRETFRASRRVRAVTAQDVRRVATRYFGRQNRTVATLVQSKESR